MTTSLTTDYVGNKIYENGNLKRILIDGGYIEGGKYHYYLTDYLGNNRAVAEASGTIIQQTQYYPFGMAFAENVGMEKQPYKYNNKELDTKHGLNMYDYSARYLDNAVPRFSSVDPLAEKYYSWSPYVYVMNNPLRNIDPDGRQHVTVNGQKVDRNVFVAWWKSFKSEFGFVERKEDYSTSGNAKESEEHNQEQKARMKATAEGIHTANETMLGFVPFGEVAYKEYWDKDITKEDFAFEAIGIIPIGKFAKGGKALRVVGQFLESIDDVMVNPNLLKGKTPMQIESILGKTSGWKIETLGKGSQKGNGWVLREYTPRDNPTGRQLRWHPGGGHKGAESYWRVVGTNGKLGGVIK